MANAKASVDLPINPDEVWNLIGGFGSLPNWLPNVPNSELSEGGRVRSLAMPDGAVIVERLLTYDEKRRSYTYTILQAPFPVKDYLSTVKVEEADHGQSSTVTWSGEFTPTNASDAEATAIFSAMYVGGMKALEKQLTAD